MSLNLAELNLKCSQDFKIRDSHITFIYAESIILRVKIFGNSEIINSILKENIRSPYYISNSIIKIIIISLDFMLVF